MTWIIVLVGALVAGIGVVGAARPDALLRLVAAAWKSPAALPAAVGVRLVLGVALLVGAPECRFPDAMRALGVVALVAAAVGALVGRARVEAFVAWWLARSAGFVRAWCAFAVAFGAFLVYAAA